MNGCWQFSHSSVPGFPVEAANRPTWQTQPLTVHFPVISTTARTDDGFLSGGAGDTDGERGGRDQDGGWGTKGGLVRCRPLRCNPGNFNAKP